MTTTADLRAVVETYWSAADARDWDVFATTLADEVLYDLPQTRERIRGKERYLRFNREYPGDWRVRVERVVADGQGRQAAVRTRFTVGAEELPAIHRIPPWILRPSGRRGIGLLRSRARSGVSPPGRKAVL
ncbi:nuclear transport factor 2 family protein [Streptomyces atratus]|uniref:SnoaL-like domain-containing protein n=1 Tax=Streptomyces atratus TaxID=1893 RepID=A0A1K2EJ21_STRAR|nr:nuclear transport factor 2 family protein [Streptomyces atratus]SFY35178.1 SnoaL-like domain-containing protein [Streptomyces atratus]